MKTVLTIAGFDPSSGAGVTADLAVFAAHGLFGTACVTALTVQNTVGVRAVHGVGAGVVAETLACLAEDLPPSGVKIGMLADAETVEVVTRFVAGLPNRGGTVVVLDPVVRSSSGRDLLSVEGLEAMRRRLLPEVDWVTPNLSEVGALLGEDALTREELPEAVGRLQAIGHGVGVVATGGHLVRPDDLFLAPVAAPEWITGEWVETTCTHGTGCTYSSAFLARLVLGDSAREAAVEAKRYVTEALRRAEPVGRGRGPLNHLWPLRGMKKL